MEQLWEQLQTPSEEEPPQWQPQDLNLDRLTDKDYLLTTVDKLDGTATTTKGPQEQQLLQRMSGEQTDSGSADSRPSPTLQEQRGERPAN